MLLEEDLEIKLCRRKERFFIYKYSNNNLRVRALERNCTYSITRCNENTGYLYCY